MKRYYFLILIIIIPTQLQADFFEPFTTFVDWIYDIAESIKDSIADFFINMVGYAIYYWIKLKIYGVTFLWSVVEPLISSLNLSQNILNNYSGLDSNILAAVFQLRIPEAINILISAYITKKILGMVGW
ncbi:MAG: DUF2523 domain-containing protein [Planctomycetes bacterium]|nr:DUF2523 domain-containing protein [Planctomycetota bacterium]